MRNWTDRINQINRSYRIVQSFQGFRTDPNLLVDSTHHQRYLNYPIRLT